MLVNQNDKKQIPLKVTPSGSSITLDIQSVYVGVYHLQVHQVDSGLVKATVNTTLTAVIQILTVSPLQGSVNGNTNLTITGVNLLHDKSKVFIGSAKNPCKIISQTATQINCITRKYLVGAHPVILEVRGFDKSICANNNNCQFTYDQAVTPIINEQVLQYNQTFDDIISFTGTNLVDSAQTEPAVLVLNNDYFIYSIEQTATSLRFKLNNNDVQQGKYFMTVYVKGRGVVSFGGISQMRPVLDYKAKLESVSASSGSYAGHLLSLPGVGFNHLT